MPDKAAAKAQAEAVWRESERRLQEVIGVTELSPDFRALFEATPRPFLVLAADLTIVAVNDACLRATITERAALLGRTLFDAFPDDPGDPKATGARNLHASLGRVLAMGRTNVMPEQGYPVRRPAALGGGFEERWWGPVNAPVPGRDGTVALIIHSVVDITAQKRDQQTLRFTSWPPTLRSTGRSRCPRGGYRCLGPLVRTRSSGSAGRSTVVPPCQPQAVRASARG